MCLKEEVTVEVGGEVRSDKLRVLAARLGVMSVIGTMQLEATID